MSVSPPSSTVHKLSFWSPSGTISVNFIVWKIIECKFEKLPSCISTSGIFFQLLWIQVHFKHDLFIPQFSDPSCISWSKISWSKTSLCRVSQFGPSLSSSSLHPWPFDSWLLNPVLLGLQPLGSGPFDHPRPFDTLSLDSGSLHPESLDPKACFTFIHHFLIQEKLWRCSWLISRRSRKIKIIIK